MKTFAKFMQDPSSLNNTTTKQNSYRYTPKEDAHSTGNIEANIVGTESEEDVKKKKKIKDLKLTKPV
jgi:hypothetical protein